MCQSRILGQFIWNEFKLFIQEVLIKGFPTHHFPGQIYFVVGDIFGGISKLLITILVGFKTFQ
jgi:hypothetical protein